MSAPTWPRIAGWLANPTVRTARGRWRARAAHGREHAGTFAHRAPDDWAILDTAGRPSEVDGPRGLLRRFEWEGDDYHRPVGPPVAVEHDGRPAWRVQLEPPAHKRGRLELVVDAATGLCLAQRNPQVGVSCELEDLEVDVELQEALFEPARRARAEQERRAALHRYCDDRPPPTPRWFPWRRCFLEVDDCLVLESNSGDGFVARAPLGQSPPLPELTSDPVVRLDVGPWSWAVAGPTGMDEQTARRVVDSVLDRYPYRGERPREP